MPFAVMLEVDAATEKILDALADRVAPLRQLRQVGVSHHLSLGVYGELNIDLVLPALAEFAKTLRPVAVHLANIGIFPGGVIFLAPTVTAELLDVHRGFHTHLGSLAPSCLDQYRPGIWVPHITLALNIAQPTLATTVAEIMSHWTPSAARLEAIRFVELPPVRSLFHCRLSR